METNKARFEQFSDGVFAIAITLLALELRVPELFSKQLLPATNELIALWPNILTFFISFITIAIFWVNHRQLTEHITTLKRRALWANVGLLFFITLIPFATKVIGENPLHPLAIFMYSLVLFGASINFSAVWFFVHNIEDEKPTQKLRSIVGPLLYLIAAIACLANVWIAYVILLIPPLYYFLPKQSPTTSPKKISPMVYFSHMNERQSSFLTTFLRRALLMFVVVFLGAVTSHLVVGDVRLEAMLDTVHLSSFRFAFAGIATIILLCLLWRPTRMIGTLLASAFLGGSILIALSTMSSPLFPAIALLAVWIVLKLSWWKHWCLCGNCRECVNRLNAEITIKEKCGCTSTCACDRGACLCK